MSKTLCSLLSQEDNPKMHRLNHEISCETGIRWLTDCTQNNLSRSPTQLCQTTSRTAAVCNQSLRPTDSLQAAAVIGTVWLHMAYGWKVFTVEPPFNSQNDRVYAPVDNRKRHIDPSHLLRMTNDQFCCKQHIVLWINNVLQHVWLLEASAETARHCSNTGLLTNISSVIPTCDMAMHAITNMRSRRLGSMCRFLLSTGA